MSIFDEERKRRQEAEVEKLKVEEKEKIVKEKLDGVEFEGVFCSLHKEDQWGLFSIESFIREGYSVPFEFMNGNVLTLNQENIDAFRAVWVPARFAFFNPDPEKPKEDKLK